jgi:hypothetical protein
MEKNITIRPYTHRELALLYGVSWKTFQRWLKPYEKQIGPKRGHFYSAGQVRIIFECIGPPGILLFDER